MQIFLLLFLSLLPCVVFFGFILHMDRQEPEPFHLLMKVLGMGAMSVFFAGMFEIFMMDSFPILKVPFLQAFFLVGPTEEFCKLWVVMKYAWPDPDFNEENDGIVYTGMSAIGFAGLENIFYVFQHGLGVGIIRALISVPTHVLEGIFMGYFVGVAKFTSDKARQNSLIARGFIIASTIHGLFDYLIFIGKPTLALLNIPFTLILVVFGYRTLIAGRDLSLNRWPSRVPASPEIPPQPRPPLGPVISPWKIWISRPLLFLSAGFWALLFIGLMDPAIARKGEADEAILGGIVITCIPILVGLLLEFSYYQNAHRKPFQHPHAPPLPAPPSDPFSS